MLIYMALGGVGLLVLLAMLVAGGFGDHDVPIHDTEIETDHGDLDMHGGPSPFGTRILAAFLVFFGVGGIVGQYVGWSHPASSALGVALGLAGATIVHRFATLLFQQQADSQLVISQLVARPAQVTIAIPANGVGEVSLLVGAEQTSQLARSVDGSPIACGRDVVVRAVRGGQVLVSQEVNR